MTFEISLRYNDSVIPTTAAASSATSQSTVAPTTSTTAAQPVSTMLPDLNGSSHKSKAPIIGGVLGAIAALILLAALVFFVMRRRKAKRPNDAPAVLAGEFGPETLPVNPRLLPAALVARSLSKHYQNVEEWSPEAFATGTPSVSLGLPAKADQTSSEPPPSPPLTLSPGVPATTASPAPPSFVTVPTSEVRFSSYQQEVLQRLWESQASPETIASMVRMMESGNSGPEEARGSTMPAGDGQGAPPEYDFKAGQGH